MKKQRMQILAFALFNGVFVAGCATSPEKVAANKVEKAAAPVDTRAYFDNFYATEIAKASPASCPSATTEVKATQWKNLIPMANGCVAKRDWKTLENVAYVMTRVEMNSPWGFYFLSLAAEGSGDTARSFWMIEGAMKKAGKDVGIFYLQKGRLHVALKEHPKAVVEFEKAVSIDPSLMEARLYLAEIYLRDMDLDKAQSHYKAVLTKEPSSLRALSGSAELSLLQSRAKEAAEALEKVVLTYPSLLAPRLRLALIYEEILQNNEQALGTYRALRASIDSGTVKEKPLFDLNGKIKGIETTLKSTRAHASVGAPVGEPSKEGRKK